VDGNDSVAAETSSGRVGSVNETADFPGLLFSKGVSSKRFGNAAYGIFSIARLTPWIWSCSCFLKQRSIPRTIKPGFRLFLDFYAIVLLSYLFSCREPGITVCCCGSRANRLLKWETFGEGLQEEHECRSNVLLSTSADILTW